MPKPLMTPWSSRIFSRQNDQELIRDAVQRLRERRKDKPDAVQFDLLDDAKRKSVPVVTDQLLIRTTDLDADAERVLDSLGLKPEPVAGLDGKIQVITLPSGPPGQLKQAYDTLRAEKVKVSPDAIVPMGADPAPDVVWKSLCTPEPVVSPFLARPEAPTPPKVRVVVLDTGITAEQRSDRWLLELAHPNGDNVDPLDIFPSPNGFLDLGAGHGTFVAGLIQRLAPAADIEVWRVLDSDGLTAESKVAAAMVAAASGGAQLINLSLGTETVDDEEPVALAVALEMIREIEERDGREIVVVAAAGNCGTETPVYPAAFDGVVSVAALTPTLKPAPWSSRGAWVKCSAVGENVVSTYVQGREDPFLRPGATEPLDPPDEYGPSSWALWSGTSFATPQVTARIAQLAAEKGIGVRAATDQLLSGARTDPDFGVFIT